LPVVAVVPMGLVPPCTLFRETETTRDFPIHAEWPPAPTATPSAAAIQPVGLVPMGWVGTRFASRESETSSLEKHPKRPMDTRPKVL